MEKICQVFIFNWVVDPILRSYSTPEISSLRQRSSIPKEKPHPSGAGRGCIPMIFPWIVGLNPTQTLQSNMASWKVPELNGCSGAAGKINELNGGLSSPSLMTPILQNPKYPPCKLTVTNTDVEFTHQFLDHLFFEDFSRLSWLFHVYLMVQPSVNPNEKSQQPFDAWKSPGSPSPGCESLATRLWKLSHDGSMSSC